MIVVKCDGEEAFGGRTSDTFVIDDFDSLDELCEYIKMKQPVMCQEPTEYFHGAIVKEKLKKRIVYMNNYLKIKERNTLVLTEDDCYIVKTNQCDGCRKGHNGTLSASLDCRFHYDGLECLNFDKMRVLKVYDFITGLFKRV